MDERYLDHPYELAGRRIDPVVGRVCQGGEPSRLSRKQLEVLAMLAAAEGEMVPRQAFIEYVWDGNGLVGERGLTDTIYALRRSLDDLDDPNPLIRTIPRRGYQLVGEVRWVENGVSPSFSENWPVPGRPGWQLVRLLAQSEVNETWLAENSRSGERRVFRFCRSEAHLQRLRREVTLLRYLREKLTGESQVLAILGWQLDEPPYYLEMALAAHGSLADWAAARGGLGAIPFGEKLRLMVQAAAALAAVHVAGVVLRNLSPASILVDVDAQGQPVAKLGELRLGDLTDRSELAAMDISTSGWTVERTLSGQVYVAPERGNGEKAGDVYALGVVLFQVASGDLQRPLTEGWAEAIADKALRELIADCVEPRPERRPTARLLVQRLQALPAGEAGEAVVAAPSPVAPEAPRVLRPPTALGEQVGPFRLVEVLGEGGMGTVYLAEQQVPVARKVALKLVRAGMDSDQVLARFEAERQALALMDHPNVAAVYDAGCSVSRHPYFAMEYVPGLGITAHCDAARLGARARVELFLQVCDGVQHAHQKGLIHRDLKPSNLLVKSSPGQPATVKVIDFGVAKSLQGKLTDQNLQTRLGAFVGTPSYASPEQLSGHPADVDTRADVYSLGIVLYELLAGVTPYGSAELADKSPLELVKLLSEKSPPTPLDRFLRLAREEGETIASNRSQSVEHLKQLLRTDVAFILNKCLERDPEERYASVLELKKDLVRWLEDRPVEARPATRAYQLRKLVRRHRTAVVLVSLTALALLATTTTAVVGLARAKAAAREAELAADFQVHQLQSLDLAAMGSGLRARLRQELREEMLASGADAPTAEQAEQRLAGLLAPINFVDVTLDLLDGHYFEPAIEVVGSQYGDHPELQARLWQSIAETLLDLGHPTRALAAQELALEKRTQVLGPEHPLTLESRLHRGNVRQQLGQLEAAKADIEAAIAGNRRQLGETAPQTLEAREDLGELHLHEYKWEEARGHFTEVLAFRRQLLGNEHPGTLEAISNLAVLSYWTNDLKNAEAQFDEALSGLRRVHGEKDPKTLAVMVQASSVYADQGQPERGIALLRQAVQGLRESLGNEHPRTLAAISDLAVMLAQARNYEDAEPAFREVLGAQRNSIGQDNADTMTTAASLGSVLYRTGRLQEGETLLVEAAAVFRRVLGPDHGRTRYFLLPLAGLYRDTGQLEEAERVFRELAGPPAADGAKRSPNALKILSELANVMRLKGQLAAAEKLQRETMVEQRAELGAEHPDTLRSQSHLAEVLKEQGQLAEAEKLLQSTLRLQRQNPGLANEDTLNTLRRWSEVLRKQGKKEEGLAPIEEAAGVAATLYHPNDHRLAYLKLSYGQALEDLGRREAAAKVRQEAEERLEFAGLLTRSSR